MLDFIIAVISNFIEYFPRDFQVEATRYVIGAVGVWFITWVLLSGVLENRRIRKPLPALLRNKQIIREIRNSTLSIIVFVFCFSVTNQLMEVFYGGSIFKIYADVAEYGWAYLVFSVVLWTIGLDTYFYWTHRFMHLPRFYKFFHRTHHRSHNPTPFTAYSFAPPEAVLVYIFVPVFFAIVPMHDTAFISAMLIQIVRNAMAHCGYELFPRGWAQHPVLGIFATVTHHDLHHEKSNGNYAFYFTFWDRVMGTEHPEYIERFERATQDNGKSGIGAATGTA
ncbi:MAG: sterol desaturase family protein [Gammaproteobacteria bacterium]|nr:sterol desaturase family protein [Gammaproteobacteria bacterium]